MSNVVQIFDATASRYGVADVLRQFCNPDAIVSYCSAKRFRGATVYVRVFVLSQPIHGVSHWLANTLRTISSSAGERFLMALPRRQVVKVMIEGNMEARICWWHA